MKAVELKSRMGRYWRKEIRPLLVLAIAVFAIRSSLADWNDVPTGSMKPTILEGDRVYVNKLAYDLKLPFTTWHLAEWANPEAGDIVVFYSPYDSKRLVKRVVGMPGDTVEGRGRRLLLNGNPIEYRPLGGEKLRDLDSEYLTRHEFAAEQLSGQGHAVATATDGQTRPDFGPFTVPAGHYFMMGDNRDDSFDSRYYGPVARRRIVGKATSVALSFDRSHYYRPRFHRWFNSLRT
jgi:signal peptidase I